MSKARGQSIKRQLNRAMKGREEILTTEVKGHIHFKEMIVDKRGKKRFVRFRTKDKQVITPAGQVARKAKPPRLISEFIGTLGKVFLLKRSNNGHNQKRTKAILKYPRPYYRIVGSM